MKKQTKVLLAAAMLTLGASFTAMAAETYDWKVVDGEWVCYDEDGEAYDNEWVKSAGKEYYAGDDGVMQTSQWIDGSYVDSTGAKVVNAWKYLIPEGEEENDDAEEAWYYFGSKGAKTFGKKVIDGVTYYFDKEGEMLTGWVDTTNEDDKDVFAATGYNSKVVYVNEDGSRAADMWIKTVEPGVDEEEVDEPDYFWYYIGSKGAPKTGRALDINGETYFFRANGQMLSGWVADLGNNVYTNADAELGKYGDVFYCGGEDQGWSKKSVWVNDYRNTIDSADADEDSMYWFYIDNKGKLVKASKTATDNEATEMYFEKKGTVSEKTDEDVTTKTAIKKTINEKNYIFNQDGEMLSGLVKTLYGTFYYGDAEDGSMKTGEVALEEAKDEESYNFFFAKTKKNGYGAEGAAVTGAAGGKLYNNGILVTHNDDNDYIKTSVKIEGNDVWFVIDKNGTIKTSTKEYKAYDEDKEKNITYLDTRNFAFEKKDGVKKGSYTIKAN